MAKYLKQVTPREIDFWASAYLMAAAKVMDRALLEKVDLAGEKYWQKRLDLASEIADYMLDSYQMQNDCIQVVPEAIPAWPEEANQ